MVFSLLQVQTRSADEPMTTFVLCNECGNRWKVCIFLPLHPLPRHPQMPPHIRSSVLRAKKGSHAQGLTSLYGVGLQSCRSWRGAGVRQGNSARACFPLGRHLAGMGAAAHILSEDGRVRHLSAEGISRSPPHPPDPQRKNNSTAFGPHLFTKYFNRCYFL